MSTFRLDPHLPQLRVIPPRLSLMAWAPHALQGDSHLKGIKEAESDVMPRHRLFSFIFGKHRLAETESLKAERAWIKNKATRLFPDILFQIPPTLSHCKSISDVISRRSKV